MVPVIYVISMYTIDTDIYWICLQEYARKLDKLFGKGGVKLFDMPKKVTIQNLIADDLLFERLSLQARFIYRANAFSAPYGSTYSVDIHSFRFPQKNFCFLCVFPFFSGGGGEIFRSCRLQNVFHWFAVPYTCLWHLWVHQPDSLVFVQNYDHHLYQHADHAFLCMFWDWFLIFSPKILHALELYKSIMDFKHALIMK